jgi:hypothetical protein
MQKRHSRCVQNMLKDARAGGANRTLESLARAISLVDLTLDKKYHYDRSCKPASHETERRQTWNIEQKAMRCLLDNYCPECLRYASGSQMKYFVSTIGGGGDDRGPPSQRKYIVARQCETCYQKNPREAKRATILASLLLSMQVSTLNNLFIFSFLAVSVLCLCQHVSCPEAKRATILASSLFSMQ